MPVSKLMKTQSKGLGDTGKAEIDDYKEAIRSIQQKSYLRIINLHNKLMCKSKYGEVIPMRVRFNPYDTPSELEIAELSEKMSIAPLHYAAGGMQGNSAQRPERQIREYTRRGSLGIGRLREFAQSGRQRRKRPDGKIRGKRRARCLISNTKARL